MKRMFYTLLATLAMAASVVVGVHGTASAAPLPATGHAAVSEDVSIQAWPTGCTYEKSENGARAKCTNANGGHYKASVNCRPWDGGAIFSRDAAVWISSGWSWVGCPSRSDYASAGIWTKAS